MSFRALPQVDSLMNTDDGQKMVGEFGHRLTVAGLRHALAEARNTIGEGGRPPEPLDLLHRARGVILEWLAPHLRQVINATGVILHTNLGRSPLAPSALTAVQRIADGYASLEYEIASGERGGRGADSERLLRQLTGAEAALIVNNNAAAVLLALSALASGREVLISRTQLIEIGGGFRIPEVLEHSGARLKEIGTTNRTHLSDFERAASDQTGVILRVHHSNFRLVGFTAEPTLAELVKLGRRAGLPVVDDLGSGTLLETADFGLAHEPTVQESVQAGADVVTFSGDKLLGGPQAGLIVGRADPIESMRRHPLARAVRADKMQLAALQATLQTYARDQAVSELPVWRMIDAEAGDLKRRVEGWAQAVQAGTVAESESAIGGGSLPGETLPTWVWRWAGRDPEGLLAGLRQASLPVIGRIEQAAVLLDPRTVLPEQDAAVVAALEAALEHQAASEKDWGA